MDRRKFLLGLGSASVGGSALIGSGAFTRVESQRNVSIKVAEDAAAYLGLKPLNTPNSMNYVAYDDDGHLEIDVSDGGMRPNHTPHEMHGSGVNSDSRTWFDGMFDICNQGKDDVCVKWEFSEDFESRDDAELMFYYDGDDDGDPSTEGRVDVAPGREVGLPLGQCVTMGLRTETFDVDATAEGSLFEGTVELTADVEGDCSFPGGGGESCTDPMQTTWSLNPDPDDEDAGGPVVLMGIDKEDGGVGGHGPISTYANVVDDILGRVSNGQSGILVVGGQDNSDVTEFWDEISTQTGATVTYVRGASNIQSATFDDYAMLGIVDSDDETSDGMTQAENDALAARSDDVATFVNDGGGILGGTQTGFSNPWEYISDIGDFTFDTGQSYSDVTPTQAGNDMGIQDPDLDICCWHDVFTDWPDFLDVVAWRAGDEDEDAAALGGEDVVLPVLVDIALSGPANVEVGQTESYDLTVTNEGDAKEDEDVELEVQGGDLVASPGAFTLTENYDNTWTDGVEVTCDQEGPHDVTVSLVGVDSGDTVAELTAQINCVSDDPGVCD